jgi:predicted DNA-binding transcriptional regulator AlpA
MASITRANDAIEPVMITARQLAVLLQVSTRQVWRMLSAGRVPTPIRVGGIVRWRMAEVENWIAEGCPAQSRMKGR